MAILLTNFIWTSVFSVAGPLTRNSLPRHLCDSVQCSYVCGQLVKKTFFLIERITNIFWRWCYTLIYALRTYLLLTVAQRQVSVWLRTPSVTWAASHPGVATNSSSSSSSSVLTSDDRQVAAASRPVVRLWYNAFVTSAEWSREPHLLMSASGPQ